MRWLMIGGKVILQLSGGKDSVACLLHLLEEYDTIEAIHFVHQFSYDVTTKMSIMVCEQLNVKLHIVDINDEIQTVFLNRFYERPCRHCKAIMDQKTVDFAMQNSFDVICVGDTADDTMLVNRIKDLNGTVNKYSRYFNAKVELPENIVIYRPLIDKTSSYTMDIVCSRFPSFVRVNDTGDKYFEYSREGCPLQFKDLGVCFSKELMYELKKMNVMCSKFATEKGIKASIHLPSEFIVTIPEGYEDDCRNFLINNGCELKNIVQPEKNIYSCIISVYLTPTDRVKDFLKLAILRFSERMKFNAVITTDNNSNVSMESDGVSIVASFNRKFSIVNIIVNSITSEIFNFNLRNICLEIFHTNKIYINQTLLK